MRWPARMRADEGGATLVELMIGMVIVSIIIGAIGSALIVGLRTTDVTAQRLSESHDAQISSSYLANDVQSASAVEQPPSSAHCPGGGTRLIGFSYSNGQWACYFWGISGGETQVRRSFGGSTVVLTHFAGTSSPSVTCTPACDATHVESASIALSEASGYGYTLVGARRMYSPIEGTTTGTGGTPDLTLFAMSSGSNSPLWIAGGCSQGQINQGDCIVDPGTPNNPSDNPSLTVNGNLYVNSQAQNAVRLTGKKNATKLTVNGGDFRIWTPGGCQGCTHNTVTCTACAWTTGNQPWTGYSPTLQDPLRFMTYPNSSVQGSCTGGTCQPGVYAAKLQITSTTTFNSGIYILMHGLSVTGNNTKLTGAGVMLFNASASSTDDINFAGGSSISLTPPTSGTYKNILIFQNRSNTAVLKITGGSSAGLTFGGVIYVPNSDQVTLSTGGATLRVTAVVAQNIKISSNAQVIVG